MTAPRGPYRYALVFWVAAALGACDPASTPALDGSLARDMADGADAGIDVKEDVLDLSSVTRDGSMEGGSVDMPSDSAGDLGGDVSMDAPKPDSDQGQPQVLQLHLYKPEKWAGAYAHYWDSDPGSRATSWPGVAMVDEGGGWYGLSLAGQNSVAVVFNDGLSQSKTVDLRRVGPGWFVPAGQNHEGSVVGRWFDENPDSYPQLAASPSGGKIYEDTLPVQLWLAGAHIKSAKYSIDGTDPRQGEDFQDGDVITLGSSLAVGARVELRLWAVSEDGHERTLRQAFTRHAPQPKEIWDPADHPLKVTQKGRFVFLEGFNNDQGLVARTVRIYLPADYASKKRRYGVIYFHDGQNLFDKKTATFGAEWMVDERYDELELERQIEPMIIVGIDNGGADRTREYVGDDSDAAIGDAKAAYTAWLIHSLKPYIDHHYRTRPQADYTVVMGSSFGGLISFYQSWNHPEVFGHAGCVSTAFWRNGAKTLTDFEAYQGPKKPVRYWVDAGNEESAKGPLGRSTYVDRNRRFAEKLAQLGWDEGDDLGYLELMEAEHHESAWSERIKGVLSFLVGRRRQPLAKIRVRSFKTSLAVGEGTSVSVDLFYGNDLRQTKLRSDRDPVLLLSDYGGGVVSLDTQSHRVVGKASGTAKLEAHYLGLKGDVSILVP